MAHRENVIDTATHEEFINWIYVWGDDLSPRHQKLAVTIAEYDYKHDPEMRVKINAKNAVQFVRDLHGCK